MRRISLQLKSNRVRPGFRLSEARFSRGCIALIALEQLAQRLAGKFVVCFGRVNLPGCGQRLLNRLDICCVAAAFFDRSAQPAHFRPEAGRIIRTGPSGERGRRQSARESRPRQHKDRKKRQHNQQRRAPGLRKWRGPIAGERHGMILKRTSWASCWKAEPHHPSGSSSAECRMLPCVRGDRNKGWRWQSSGSA